jgi:TRAP-type C4-dicarboxylate transport system substrate-binding protein
LGTPEAANLHDQWSLCPRAAWRTLREGVDIIVGEKSMRKLLWTLAAVAISVSAGAAQAAEKWDMASGFPDNNFHTKNIREFVAKIKADTKELDIVLHTNQSLFKLQDSKKAVQSGQVPMAELLLVQFGNEDPIYEISAIPFLADTIEKAQKLWSVSRGPLSERLAKDGIRLLYGVTWPVQGFYAKTPITSVANFKGVKMRTYSAMTGRMAEEMGAIPTNVVFSEIPQAFSTGLVSTMYTSPATGVDTQAWDYTKHFVNVGGNFTMNVVIGNERSFRRLDAATQKVVMDAAAEAETRGWKMSQEVRAELEPIGTTLTAEWLKKAGPGGEQIIEAYRKQ